MSDCDLNRFVTADLHNGLHSLRYQTCQFVPLDWSVRRLPDISDITQTSFKLHRVEFRVEFRVKSSNGGGKMVEKAQSIVSFKLTLTLT